MSYAVRMHDERVAFLSLEQLVWRGRPVCPHCGDTARLGRLNGVSTAAGTWKCYSCRKPFTARHGTILHNSHVPTHIWLQALYLLVATDRKIGSQRLGLILGVSVRTAWNLKLKIAAGLDGEAGPDAEIASDAPDRVIRCPAGEEPGEAQPGHGVCATRHRRFLAALEGIATEATDRQFVEALSRLLRAPARSGPLAEDGPCERQLELGLFSKGECQMAAENGRDGSAPQPKA